ncbi:type II toxin-antitoxin system PemK/MazF family toxin [Sulfurimonas sp. SAG-AH-194-I05]|nr:type II toxin-antitoxin system PemK/MazF family toxin [Sulfurimonas sp. SAG-AH-194-I05]MDF1875764.1 type II toxin-antitoxin system PemK/MazF family toxin [Sulfurimonas sp. SAG-AH-194-I05]
MFRRGDIHLAKLYPSKGHEVGKTRPVLILQTDLLNNIEHTTIIVLPLTTQLIDNTYPLRFRIEKRDNLKQISEVLCDQIRTIDINRLHKESIASLNQEELLSIEEQVQVLLDFS